MFSARYAKSSGSLSSPARYWMPSWVVSGGAGGLCGQFLKCLGAWVIRQSAMCSGDIRITIGGGCSIGSVEQSDTVNLVCKEVRNQPINIPILLSI